MEYRYKVGWYDKDGKRRYIVTDTREEMLAVVADKITISDSVSVKAISGIRLGVKEPDDVMDETQAQPVDWR